MPYTLLRALCALIAATVILPISSAAFAEEAEGRRIEEVIVTAERKEASIQDTSISISAFTDQFLDDFGIRNQEDLQNFVPATTIQPYDATIRGVGRNFRALGGDPGVSTYMNGIYSEDLLTATAATFWDVERIEVLRGPQGTLYGRNAIGGAVNILYKQPTNEFEAAVKGIVGNFGAQEVYGALSGPLVKDKLMGRINFAHRERDGVVKEIEDGPDIDSLGTDNFALLLKWTPTDTLEFDIRHNWMDINRVFGGSNGGGLVMLNQEGNPTRPTDALVPGYRFVDTDNTDPGNFLQNNWYDQTQPILEFVNPNTGAIDQAQRNRAGIDYGDFDGWVNSFALLTNPLPANQAEAVQQRLSGNLAGTGSEDAQRYNDCVFPGKIKGDDVCAGTNGHNWEEFEQEGTQFSVAWDLSDTVTLKYLYGHNALSYERITDDDNSGSMFRDRQFYVNHEARYESHELQAFYDIGERLTFTSGIFFYDATINQRGDLYSSVEERRYRDAYQDNSALSEAAAEILGCAPDCVGLPASLIAFGGAPMVNLFSARDSCLNSENPAPSCESNYAVQLANGEIEPEPGVSAINLQTSAWYGDDGTDRSLDVYHGPRTVATDLLYATETQREAFAFYTQGVWNMTDALTLTLGIRYAEDEVVAEENLFRYSETQGGPGELLALYGGLAAYNVVNGGLVDDGTGNLVPTDTVVNGGIPFALSLYRPFDRKDDKVTWRANLDWDISDSAMMYFSATTGHRGGGYSLLYVSATPTYEPEELIAYEIGYKTQWLDDRLQVNGSFYYYDYESIHTFTTEVGVLGNTTTSVLAAPGAEIYGIEAEATWLATDRLTLGGNFSYTPSEYSESFLLGNTTQAEAPGSLYPDFDSRTQDIKGNQVLQVPEGKATGWASYRIPLQGGSSLDLFGTYTWIDDVYYSPFESDAEKADSYDRVDLRATFTSGNGSWIISAFVNNVFDDIGVLQIVREGEGQTYPVSAGVTVPRHYGLEVTFQTGRY